MSKLFYPAVFHTAEEGGFWVTFPDFPETFTQGEDMEDAYQMAVDALGMSITGMEEAGATLPAPSVPVEIKLDEKSMLMVIEFDMQAYKKKTGTRAVKKTLTIPEWLNEEALSLNLNFSQILQEALIHKITMIKNGR